MPQLCEGELPIAAPDYCYVLVDRHGKGYKIIDRGCFPYTGTVGADQALFYCMDQGCNMYGIKNNIFCRYANETYYTHHVLNNTKLLMGKHCMDGTPGIPPMCYAYLDGK